jgi:membrane associated rhomboid family serine protease
MNVASFFRSFVIIAILVFVVAGAVSFLYSLIVHGSGQVDWESAVRLGIILGIVLPFVKKFEDKK